ncbi:MAG: hypothetical protein GY811_10920 [Myxococcales bacterium]|nr:hypothetical protein [Myxococcales bacterium]
MACGSRRGQFTETIVHYQRIPETNAIFKRLECVREEATQSNNQLLISADAKATVKIGELSRGGKSRVPVRALDQDFVSSGKATPLGLLLPELDELSITVCTSKVVGESWRTIGTERCSTPWKRLLATPNR